MCFATSDHLLPTLLCIRYHNVSQTQGTVCEGVTPCHFGQQELSSGAHPTVVVLAEPTTDLQNSC